MIPILAFCLLASATNASSVQSSRAANTSVTHPSFIETPKRPDDLRLYNKKGELVARCKRKGETFQDCKMESGVTLDEVMNAWVHAYMDVLQK